MDDNSPKLETHSLNIFPALIPFWFTIHGLPLHYWTDEAIGNDLGPVEKFEVERTRIRVWVNGLRPLEMILDISLPSGEIKQVELEYKNLEKHCFICHYLSHDKDNCPSQQAQANTRFSGAQAMGISQNRTWDRLESDRRRQAEKKLAHSDLPYQPLRAQNSGSWQRPSHGEATYGLDWKNDKNFRFTYGARKDPYFQCNSTRDSDPPARRHSAKERLSFEKVVVSESQGLFVS